MTASTTVDTLAELPGLVGTDLGTSSWIQITQERVNTFADATDDHQWIHVDPARAKDGPFGGPIAHGYLTLSLVIPMLGELLEVRDVGTKINYGLNKVRFPAPVPVRSKVRATAGLAAVEEVPGGAQLTIEVTVHREGSDKPVCVAQVVHRFLKDPQAA